MTRYAAMFQRCAAAGEGAFGAFLMLGDPDFSTSATLLDALVEGGADMVELGIPFSDPVADGPVIQAAAIRALGAGVRTRHCLELVTAFRSRHPEVPIGILTYANIVAARGVETFCAELAAAGVDSLLVADVPSIEAAPYAAAARAAGVDLVMIAAPNTPVATLETLAAMSSGYTYCVARAGVTGADAELALDHAPLFAALRDAGAPPPVLGFGISSPDQVGQALRSGAAGVISGSAIVAKVSDGAGAVRDFVAAMKAATR
ncbi:MAG: tryptophan synthase subunit alpha [Pseudomonadota bacterium]|nr:tryptophan synthase subunit alpha [Pseudomonadota bacterium]